MTIQLQRINTLEHLVGQLIESPAHADSGQRLPSSTGSNSSNATHATIHDLSPVETQAPKLKQLHYDKTLNGAANECKKLRESIASLRESTDLIIKE